MGHSNDSYSSSHHLEIDISQMNPTQAIEIIMDTYGEEVKRLIYSYLQNASDTDDVTQEVFVTVYQKIDAFQGKSSIRSWIYSIAINKCKDHLRSWKSRNKRLKEKLIQSSHVLIKTEDTPEEYAVKKSESNQLLDKVMHLSMKYKEVIILYYFKELSTREISQILQIKEASVRTRLIRGRSKLKLLLSKERGENPWIGN